MRLNSALDFLNGVRMARNAGILTGDAAMHSTPLWMPRYNSADNKIAIQDGAAANTSRSTTFWTFWNYSGAHVNTAWTAGVSKQIVSVTGPCIFMGAIGPASVGASDTTQIDITVDGRKTTIPAYGPAAATRNIVGPLMMDNNTFGTTGTTNFLHFTEQFAQDTGSGYQRISSSHTTHFPSPLNADFFGLSRRFTLCRKSLLVEMTHSVDHSTTTNEEQRAGVRYMVFP